MAAAILVIGVGTGTARAQYAEASPTPEVAPTPAATPVAAPVAVTLPALPGMGWELGGFFTGSVHYDTNNQAERPWVSRVPGRVDESVLLFDAAGTRINVTGTRSGPNAKGKGVLEIDFKGDGKTFFPRIRHAYASLEKEYGSLLIGQTWTLIGMSGPTTYNWNWMFFQGNPYNRVPQVRIGKNIGTLALSLGAYLNNAGNGSSAVVVDGANNGTAAMGDNDSPIIQARLQQPVLKKGYVAVAGAFGETRIFFTPNTGSTVAAFDDKIPVAMGTLDFSLPMDRIVVSGKAWYSLSGGYNSVIGQAALIDATQEIHPIAAYGGWLDLVVKLPAASQISVYGAMDDPEDEISGTAVKLSRNITFGGTVSREVVEKAIFGLEVQYTETETNGAVKKPFNDVRTSLVMQYKL